MKRLLFIYNPQAGQGRMRKRLSDIVDAFVDRGYIPAVYPTQAPGDATRLVQAIGRHYRRVVCCGGDGTLHEVAAALMDMDDPPVLGYVPAGSTNDVSRNLHLPKSMTSSAAVAAGNGTMRFDMGRFNGEPFVYVAAFGLFTDVSYATSQKAKNMFGHLAYLLEGAGRLAAIQSFHVKVEYDEGTVEDDFILGMASNTRSVGGFQGLPVSDVELDDGKFELVLVRSPKNAADVQSILRSVITRDPVEGGPILGLRSSRVKFTADAPLEWTLDGEYGGSHRMAEVENIHQALELCCVPKG